MGIERVQTLDDHLRIHLSGETLRFHFLWLRDNMPAAFSANGQRLHETNALDPLVHPTDVSFSDRQINVIWSDGVAGEYSAEFLNSWSSDGVASPSRTVWDASLPLTQVTHSYGDVLQDDRARLNWLRDAQVRGFSILTNVPTKPGSILDVVRLFGIVRETNYGRVFDVRAEAQPSNLAYTPVPLSVHTDNPYRNPCPGLQLLHCLRQSDEGGVTVLVDGFRAAEQLREQDTDAFELLSNNDFLFHYYSEDARLECRDRIIATDSAGNLQRVRINNRSLAPVQLPLERIAPFYQAIFAFRSVLESPDAQLQYRMAPGDLVLLDNERVLHGRAGHAVGERHLQGCYADRDSLNSAIALLETRYADA